METENNLLKLSDIEFFKEIAETGDDLFCWMDSWGRFRYVSPSAEKILGIKPDLCIGRKVIFFLHREDRRQTVKTIQNCVEKGIRSTTIENRVVSRNGEMRHLIWTVNLKCDPTGALIRINAIGKDISKRKQAYEQLLIFSL
jgi:PAS domain S-box-containing protein